MNNNPKIILATDCGSTTTKAILIELKMMNIIHLEEAPTTVKPIRGCD